MDAQRGEARSLEEEHVGLVVRSREDNERVVDLAVVAALVHGHRHERAGGEAAESALAGWTAKMVDVVVGAAKPSLRSAISCRRILRRAAPPVLALESMKDASGGAIHGWICSRAPDTRKQNGPKYGRNAETCLILFRLERNRTTMPVFA